MKPKAKITNNLNIISNDLEENLNYSSCSINEPGSTIRHCIDKLARAIKLCDNKAKLSYIK